MLNSAAKKSWPDWRRAGPAAYDIEATFGDGQPGRNIKRILDVSGRSHLDQASWEAGEVAYQCLKQLFPKGITKIEFAAAVDEAHSLVSDELYPMILSKAEAGKIQIEPDGVNGLKAAWADYDWCEQFMFVFDFIERAQAAGGDFDHPLNVVLPLALLQRLDDAVIAEFCDGRGLPDVMLEVGALRDRITPPNDVKRLIETSSRIREQLDGFRAARRKGANVIHAETRAMKAEVFSWLDRQPTFRSNEAAAREIIKQQPIVHTTARDWYREWKKLRPASKP